MALCALQIEGYPDTLSEVERCIWFVEKIVNSEKETGVNTNNIEVISKMMNKKEIIIPFWEHYQWYFEGRYPLEDPPKNKTEDGVWMSFSDVFE